jgi:DNA-binding IclR family transcriptional regulator
VIFCHCARAERPVSIAEVVAALKLDHDVVARCLMRLDEEKLLEATAQTGTYVFAAGRRAAR